MPLAPLHIHLLNTNTYDDGNGPDADITITPTRRPGGEAIVTVQIGEYAPFDLLHEVDGRDSTRFTVRSLNGENTTGEHADNIAFAVAANGLQRSAEHDTATHGDNAALVAAVIATVRAACYL